MKKMFKDAVVALIGAAILGAIYIGLMYGMGELMMLLGIA